MFERHSLIDSAFFPFLLSSFPTRIPKSEEEGRSRFYDGTGERAAVAPRASLPLFFARLDSKEFYRPHTPLVEGRGGRAGRMA